MVLSSRSLEPEWLDALPPGDARARRSRRDLGRIRALMGCARVVCRELDRRLGAQGRIADLGAGDGRLMLQVARRLRRPGIRLTLVDRAAAVEGGTVEDFLRLRWHATVAREDAFEFLRRPEPGLDAIVANLFLHHFSDERLAELLALAASRAPLVVACEPRRSRLALAGAKLSGFIGCSRVTRHDAMASVRAGFRDGEISALWPAALRGGGWRLAEVAAGPFAHLFVAQRA